MTSNLLNSLLKVNFLNGWMMEEFIPLNTWSFLKPIIENINYLVQRSLGPVLNSTSKNKSDIRGQEWLQETLILRFIVLLTIISLLKTIFKRSSMQLIFQKSIFCSKPNLIILLINTKRSTSLKKNLNKVLKNIS